MAIISFTRFKSSIEDIYLIDSDTTHTLLKDRKYFSYPNMREINVNTISDSVKLIKGLGRVNILLLGGTTILIHKALFSSKSQRNFLNFKNIHRNKYYIKTMEENGLEYLCITQINSSNKTLLEKLPPFLSNIYSTKIPYN
jgi:hypothetical protein